MFRPSIGVRWWLGIAFAVVAATSTAIVVSQFSDRSENAFRNHGENVTLKDAQQGAKLPRAKLERLAEEQNVKFRIVGTSGASGSPLERKAVDAALGGNSFVEGDKDGGVFVAAVPYHGESLVAVNRLPDVAEAIDTVNGEALRAGVIAGVIGVETELGQGQQLPDRVRDLPGQHQRAAAVAGRLGSPAHQPQD